MAGIAQRKERCRGGGHYGQYADLVELAIHRPVKRVPLLGGRISLEAVREGIARVLAGGPSEPPIPPEPTEHQPRAPLGVG